MKRLSTIIMALALVLGMSQCKKQETPTNGNSGEMVHITLNVNDSESLAVNVNDNGGRHAVAPSLGVVQFTNGDKLYVGNNGHYVGYLNYVVDESGRRFEGNINGDACSTSDKLHFYFLGGKGPDVTTISGNPESFTINIADQTDNLPVLCYGASNEDYRDGGSYSAVLEYKCALVRFNLKNDVYGDVTLSNVLTEATINFANNTITPTTTKGDITLYGEDGVVTHRWGILLPETDLSHTTHPDLLWQGSGNMPTVDNNTFVNAGGTQGFQLLNPPYPAPPYTLAVHNSNSGANNKLSVFSVSSTKKVYFSRANLMYKTADNKWGFHDNQVDECSTSLRDGSYVQQAEYAYILVPYGTVTTDMDRFTWGHLNVTAQAGRDYVTGEDDLSVERGTDWGCVFKIEDTWEVDMPKPENTHWRTLTASEWNYLLNSRGNRSFMMVKFYNPFPAINEYSYGLLVFPDNFVFPTGLTSLFNASNCNKTDQYYWIDKANDGGAWNVSGSNMYKLLAAGAVFLPGVGLRMGEYYYRYNYFMQSSGYAATAPKGQGYYWTASVDEDLSTGSHYFWFGIHGDKYWKIDYGTTQSIPENFGVGNATVCDPNTTEYNGTMRQYGMCVRLVWDAN